MPPKIALPRQGLSMMDIIWIIPPMFHLAMLLGRVQVMEKVEPYLAGWSPASKNHLYGFFVQFTNVWLWGGDGFNVAGLLARTELGMSRFVRVLLQFVGVVALAHVCVAAMGDKFVQEKVVTGLPAVKVSIKLSLKRAIHRTHHGCRSPF